MKRIVFIKGKQKQLIESAKLKFNNWDDMSKYLDYNPIYLSIELRNEKRTLSEETYNKLCKLTNKNFDNFIVKKIDSNWGQVIGGKSVRNRKNLFQDKKPKLLCKKSEKLAEIIGIILGDGSIHSIPDRGIYQVRITGNSYSKEEIFYLSNYVKNLFVEVFHIFVSVKIFKNGNYLYKQSKDLVYTLNFFGLPSGNKKKNNVKIPNWIFNNKNYLIACLRGLFDTDGYVYPKSKSHKYATISISSAIPNLRKSITKALEKLDIDFTDWRKKRKGAHEAHLRTRNDNFKFVRIVSFRNPKHIKKWKLFSAPLV